MSASAPYCQENAPGGSSRLRDDLPGVLREIAEVAGLDAALRLAQLRGGGRVSIPSRVRPGCWLALAIGEDKAKAVSFHFTSGHTSIDIEIPLGAAGLRARTIATVRQLISEGVSADLIARRVGVSSRMVRRHRSAMRLASAAQPECPAIPATQASGEPTEKQDV